MTLFYFEEGLQPFTWCSFSQPLTARKPVLSDLNSYTVQSDEVYPEASVSRSPFQRHVRSIRPFYDVPVEYQNVFREIFLKIKIF